MGPCLTSLPLAASASNAATIGGTAPAIWHGGHMSRCCSPTPRSCCALLHGLRRRLRGTRCASGSIAPLPQLPNQNHLMNCPKCNHGTVFVLQSNTTKPNHTTRQRVCNDCKHKWFTVELTIESWAVKWEKVNPDFRFGGKPTPCVPVSILYGDDNG